MDFPWPKAIIPGMDFDCLIAGGGLNGCAMALALAKNGLSVALVDPVPAQSRAETGFDGRAYALSIASLTLLRRLGLAPLIAADSQPILHIGISDGRPGEGPSPLTLEFDHGEIEEGPLGAMLEDRHLRPALIGLIAAEPRITAFSGLSVTAQAPRAADILCTLSDGRQISAAVLIGSDGKASATAQRAGISRWGWSYDQTALVCAVAHERPHEGKAHQFFMPGGPLAILPLRENRSGIVWSERKAEAARLSALPDTAFLDELRPRFGDWLGEISLAGARWSYPLTLSIAQNFCAERVALVGDAAHVVHPVAGQGLNAGLKDVAALAEVLVLARRRGEDIGRPDVLERYQRWRRFDVASLALATDTVVRSFSNDFGPLRLARDLGLAAVQALAPLRRGLTREAAGLTGDLPRLLKGLPL